MPKKVRKSSKRESFRKPAPRWIGGVANPGPEPQASQCQVMETISQRFNIDAPLDDEKEFELSEDDFPPSNFDFQKVLQKIKNDLSEEEEDDEDFSKSYSEVIASNKKAALAMGFCISEDELIKDLEEDSKLLVFPTTSGMKDTAGKSRRSRSTNEDENSLEEPPACKKLKVNPVLTERVLSSPLCKSPNTQYVFCVEKSTSKKRVIPLREGEELPEGLELASIRDFPVVPDEVSTVCVESLGKTQQQSKEDKSSQLSKPSPNSKSDVSSVKDIPLSKSSKQHVSPTSGKKSRGLASLSDLMTQGMNISQTEARIPISIPSTSTSSPYKPVDTQRSSQGKIVDVVTLESDEDDNEQPRPNHTISDVNVAIPPMPVLHPHPPADDRTPIIYSFSQAQQSQNSGPVIIQTRSLKRVDPLFNCKFCGEKFLCYDDHLFRMHLLLKHEEDISIKDDTYFDKNRIFTSKLKECRKCQSYMLKMGDHQQTCGESTYDVVTVDEKKLLKHGCGICPKSFSARYELKKHIDINHRSLWRKIILTPGFRCAQCLKSFDSSLNLLKHCLVCMDLRPKGDTLYHLTKSFLYCDICSKSHPTVQETMTCYKNKSLQRCSLCFEVHKDMYKFYQHLNNHHGMVGGSEKKPGEKVLTLPCPLCTKEKRGKYDEIFSHVVKDHYHPARQAQYLRGEMSLAKVPPPQLIAVGNFKRQPPSVIVNPTTRVTSVTSQQAPVVPGRIIINTNRIDPSTSFPPGTFVTASSTTAPVVGGSTTQFTQGNVKNLFVLNSSSSAIATSGVGGIKRVQLPLQKPVSLGHGDIVQFVPPKPPPPLPLLRPAVTAPKASMTQSSANRVILPKATAPSVTQPGANVIANSTSAFTISTTAQPKISNVSCLSTAVTFTSPSSASNNLPITSILPNYANVDTNSATSSSSLATHGNGMPLLTPANSKAYIQVLNPKPKLSRLISTATATIASQNQNQSPVIPNLPSSMSIHPVDPGSGTMLTSTSASTSASNSNTSNTPSLSVSLVPASPEKKVSEEKSPP